MRHVKRLSPCGKVNVMQCFSQKCGSLGFSPLKAMGKVLSEEEKNKKSWDSNAITPGTPFMTLLANSLRYWTVQKMNEDPAWKGVCAVSFEN